MDTDNSALIAEGKGVGEVEEGIGAISGDERRFDLGV